MGSLNPLNPLPMHLGGDPAPAERVWRMLRKALGRTRLGRGREVAGPVGGIEDLWRQCKARAVAKVEQLVELASEQAWPDRATVHIPVYEEQLHISPVGNEEQRRQVVAARVTKQLYAVIPDLQRELQEIDPGLSVVVPPAEQATVFHHGKSYAGRPYNGSYGTRYAAYAPNYSTHFKVYVLWSGLPSGLPDEYTLDRVRRHLNEVLPSWFDFVISNGAGFYLDGGVDGTSRLDFTSFD